MTDQSNLSLSQIGQISVNVHDLERAAVFYKETLGMKDLFTVPQKMAFFDCGGIRLMLTIPERPDLDHPSSILYFKVPDIEHGHEVLAARSGSPNFATPKTTSSRSCAKNRNERRLSFCLERSRGKEPRDASDIDWKAEREVSGSERVQPRP